MNEALVQNAQHEVDHEDRQHQQNAHPLQRCLKCLRRALERGVDRGRQIHLRSRLTDFRDGLRQRDTFAQVERDRHRRKLAEMVDGERADRGLQRRDRIQRNQRAAVGAHVEHRQHRRIGLVTRLELHHHPVLVIRRVNRRDLARTVRVVERALDRLRRHAERICFITIDVDGDLRLGYLQITRHVDQPGECAQLRFDVTRDAVELGRVGALQRVLVEAFRELSADPDRRNVLDERADVGKLRKRGTQLAHDLIGARSLIARLQRDEDPAGIERRARSADADERHRVLDMRILPDDVRDLLLQVLHRLERNVLRGFGDDEKLSDVIARQKALRHVREQESGGDENRAENDHREPTMAHHPGEARSIGGEHRVEHPLRPRVNAAVPLVALDLQHAAAKQRSQRQRYETGYQHRDNDRHGQLV